MVLNLPGNGFTRFHQLVSFGTKCPTKDILTKDFQNIMTMVYYLNKVLFGLPDGKVWLLFPANPDCLFNSCCPSEGCSVIGH